MTLRVHSHCCSAVDPSHGDWWDGSMVRCIPKPVFCALVYSCACVYVCALVFMYALMCVMWWETDGVDSLTTTATEANSPLSIPAPSLWPSWIIHEHAHSDRGLLKCRYVLLYHRMFHKHTHTCTIALKFRIRMEQWGCAEEKQTELPCQPFYMWMFVFWGM